MMRRVLLGLLVSVLGILAVERSWARCEDCPVPFSVLAGSWVIADDVKKAVLVVDPERRPGKSKQVGARLVDPVTCTVVASGSLKHIRNSSILTLQLRDADRVLRTALVSVADDDSTMMIEAPCPRSSFVCFWTELSQRAFRRMSTGETLLPYCSAFTN